MRDGWPGDRRDSGWSRGRVLLKRYELTCTAPAACDPGLADASETSDDAVTAGSLINTLFVVLLCLAAGKLLAELVAHTEFILPDFVFALLLAVLIRNGATLTGRVRVSDTTVDVVGDVALSLFLVMALMTMRLLDLANLAGPLLVILIAQTVIITLFATW